MGCRGLFGLLVAVLLQLAVSLPPDFFRNGRSSPALQRLQSDTSAAVKAACSYCSSLSPKLEDSCFANVGESRRVCLIARQRDRQRHPWPGMEVETHKFNTRS